MCARVYVCIYVRNLEIMNIPLMIMVQGLMINDRIQSISKLQSALAKAEEYLSDLASDTLYSEFEYV